MTGEILALYLLAAGIICAIFGAAELFMRTKIFMKLFRWIKRWLVL